MTYNSLTVNDICDLLIKEAEKNNKLLILAHRNPDGDAVGSAFALKLIYNELMGKAVCACCHEAPEYLRFLIKGQNSLIFDENEEYDTIAAVDTASPQQLGDLEYLAEKCSFAIDHHESCTPYCDTLRDHTSSATGELIFEIYEELKNRGRIKENTDIARLIYCAISADSGSFMYSNTTSKTHDIAGKLVTIINKDENGANTAELARLLHNSKSLSALRAQMLCIQNLKICENGEIAYIILEREEIAKEGLKEEDFGASVDIPRSVEGVKLSFVIKETDKTTEDGKRVYRISTRSSCGVNVADICKKFSGGGHAKAAGGSVEADNIKIAEKTVLSEFIYALREEK